MSTDDLIVRYTDVMREIILRAAEMRLEGEDDAAAEMLRYVMCNDVAHAQCIIAELIRHGDDKQAVAEAMTAAIVRGRKMGRWVPTARDVSQ